MSDEVGVEERVITVQRVSFLDWNHAPWRDDLDAAVQDYLGRSGEEITVEEEWQVINYAMLGRQDLLFLVALDGDRLLGFCVCRLLQGTRKTGPTVHVWQVYVVPGRARLRELVKVAWPEIVAFGQQFGAARASMVTRRMTKGYDRLLRSTGFEPYSMTYETPLKGENA